MAVASGVHVEAGDNGAGRVGEDERVGQSLAREELVYTREVNKYAAGVCRTYTVASSPCRCVPAKHIGVCEMNWFASWHFKPLRCYQKVLQYLG